MANEDSYWPLDLSPPETGASPQSQQNMSESRQATHPGFGQEEAQQGNNYGYSLSPGSMAITEKDSFLHSVSRTPCHSGAVMNIQGAMPAGSANGQMYEPSTLPLSGNSRFRHVDKCTPKSCLSTAEEVCLDCYISVIPKLCHKCFRQRHSNNAQISALSINAFFNIAQKTTKERNAVITPLPPSYRASSTAATSENNMGTSSEAAEVYECMCIIRAVCALSSCEGVATVMCTECMSKSALLLCHRCDQGLHTSDRSGHVRVPLSHLTQAWSPEELTVNTDIVLQNNTRRGVHICDDCNYPADMVCLDCEQKFCLKICPRHFDVFHRDIWSTFHYRIKLSDGTRIPSRVNGSPKPYICQCRVRVHCKNLATLVCLHCLVVCGLLICQTCDDFIHGDRLSRHRRIPVQQGTSEEQSVSSRRDPAQGDIGIHVNNEDNSGAALLARSVDAHAIADTADSSNFDADTNSETEMGDAESVGDLGLTYLCHFEGCKQKADVVCLTCAARKPRPMVLYCSKCHAIKHGQQKHHSIQINKITNETRVHRIAEASAIALDHFPENVEKDVVSGAGEQPTSLIQQPQQTPRKSNIKRRASAASVDSLDNIHERYAKVSKRVFKDGANLKSACEETGVAKQTLLDRVGTAELKIIAPNKYQELVEECSNSDRPTVKGFETRCREVIKTMFLEQVSKARKDGKLLNLKTKAYD